MVFVILFLGDVNKLAVVFGFLLKLDQFLYHEHVYLNGVISVDFVGQIIKAVGKIFFLSEVMRQLNIFL